MLPEISIDGRRLYGSPNVAARFVADASAHKIETVLPGTYMFTNFEKNMGMVIVNTLLAQGLLAVHTLYVDGEAREVFRSEPEWLDNNILYL